MISTTSQTTPGPDASLRRRCSGCSPLAAALSVDVVQAGFGIKGDEATYVAMTLSLAYDGDLSLRTPRSRALLGAVPGRDPEGLFLKRGSDCASLRGSMPFLQITHRPDRPDRPSVFRQGDRLSGGRGAIVRLLRPERLPVFHVLLLFGVGVCGYLFLAARSRRRRRSCSRWRSSGASVVPVYAAFLTSGPVQFLAGLPRLLPLAATKKSRRLKRIAGRG